MKKIISLVTYFTVFLIATNSLAQTSNLYVPLNIQKAYKNKTRSIDGNPGENYWQNRADYSINVDFNKSRFS